MSKLPFHLPLKCALHSDIQIQASTSFLKLLVCKITSEEIIMKIHFRTAILLWLCSWLRFKKPSEWIQTSHSSHWKKNHVVNHLLYFSSYLITYSGLCSFSVYLKHFPGGSDSKVFAYNAGDLCSILDREDSPGEGNGNPLQYSHLENLMDGRAW